MQKLLHDDGICQEHLTIYCDNTSAINIFKNPIQHSRTKHIEIRHHFIRELVEDGILTLEFIHIDDQKADLFTKPLNNKRFEFLCQNIGVISMDWSLSLLFLPLAFASSFYTLHCLTCFCVCITYEFCFQVLSQSSFYTLHCLTCFCLFFSFDYFLNIEIKKLKNKKNTKTVCVMCTLVLVCLGWPLKQSFLNFVSLVA